MRTGLWICLWLAGGCAEEAAKDECLDALPAECSASIPVTFAAIYDKVLEQHCGGSDSGTTCHGPEGRSGLGLFDPDTAYDDLLGTRVRPGDPKCSILVERLESNDPQYRMPRGLSALDPGLRCAVREWIAGGAARG